MHPPNLEGEKGVGKGVEEEGYTSLSPYDRYLHLKEKAKEHAA